MSENMVDAEKVKLGDPHALDDIYNQDLGVVNLEQIINMIKTDWIFNDTKENKQETDKFYEHVGKISNRTKKKFETNEYKHETKASLYKVMNAIEEIIKTPKKSYRTDMLPQNNLNALNSIKNKTEDDIIKQKEYYDKCKKFVETGNSKNINFINIKCDEYTMIDNKNVDIKELHLVKDKIMRFKDTHGYKKCWKIIEYIAGQTASRPNLWFDIFLWDIEKLNNHTEYVKTEQYMTDNKLETPPLFCNIDVVKEITQKSFRYEKGDECVYDSVRDNTENTKSNKFYRKHNDDDYYSFQWDS